LDIASGTKALLWRHALKAEVPKVKFTTLFYPREWWRALEKCTEDLRPAIQELRDLIFKSSFEAYLGSSVTPEEFARVVEQQRAKLGDAQARQDPGQTGSGSMSIE
jgi:hypothetical protein